MISGFHGNTDSVMTMFLTLAAYFCWRERPWWCGLCFALSCQIKVTDDLDGLIVRIPEKQR